MTPAPVKEAPDRFVDILKQIGPGLIISASIVGSGELIVTTKTGAENGFILLWFILFGCMIKVFVQVELGRYTVTRGQTSLDALNSIPGPKWKVSWLVWIWIGMFIATFFQVAGMVGGVAKIFTFAGVTIFPEWIIALLVAASCAILLAVGRYSLIEGLSTVMVALFTLFTIFAVVALSWTDYSISLGDIAEGFSFQLPENFTTAFAAFGVIGVGASELIYYPYWCLEKGYAKYVGPKEATEDWERRAQKWLRVLRVDAWVSMIIYTGATVAFYLLGATVLHGRGLEITDESLIANLSQLYSTAFGKAGLAVFIAGAFVVLYSTVFIATASNGRLFADLVRLFKWHPMETEEDRMRMVRWACIGLPVIYFIFYKTVEAPVALVMIGALAQALMLPFLALASVYFLYTKIEPALRPGQIWTALLWISTVLMTATGAYQLFASLTK